MEVNREWQVIRVEKDDLKDGCNGLSDQQRELVHRLFDLGGNRVVLADPEPHMAILLARGRVFSEPITTHPGQRNQCHENVSDLWARDIQHRHIVTGYALTDRIWRRHSWVLDGKTLCETTVQAEVYYGVVLPPAEAAEFFWVNLMIGRYPDLEKAPENLWDNYPGVMKLLREHFVPRLENLLAAQFSKGRAAKTGT